MSPFREQRKTQPPGGDDSVWKPPLFICEDYEKALLGALLIAGDTPKNNGSGVTHFDEVSNLVTPDMFYQPRHAALFTKSTFPYSVNQRE